MTNLRSLSIRAAMNPDDIVLQAKIQQARLEHAEAQGIQVSDCDLDLIYNNLWTLNNRGYPITKMLCPREYATSDLKGNTPKYSVSLNRAVAAKQLGVEPWLLPKNMEADHIDEQLGKTNCTRENIQLLTSSQNNQKRSDRVSFGAKLNLAYALLRDLPDEA